MGGGGLCGGCGICLGDNVVDTFGVMLSLVAGSLVGFVLEFVGAASAQPSNPGGSLWNMSCSFVRSMSLLFLLQTLSCSVCMLYERR